MSNLRAICADCSHEWAAVARFVIDLMKRAACRCPICDSASIFTKLPESANAD